MSERTPGPWVTVPHGGPQGQFWAVINGEPSCDCILHSLRAAIAKAERRAS